MLFFLKLFQPSPACGFSFFLESFHCVVSVSPHETKLSPIVSVFLQLMDLLLVREGHLQSVLRFTFSILKLSEVFLTVLQLADVLRDHVFPFSCFSLHSSSLIDCHKACHKTTTLPSQVSIVPLGFSTCPRTKLASLALPCGAPGERQGSTA